jgi:hypothetical protein
MTTYTEKKAARIDRMHARAARVRAAGHQRLDAAHQLAGMIPMGQPILVGHHSERHARRDQERIRSNMRKGIDLVDEGDKLAARAKAAESSTAVSSDDPEAQDKLGEKLAKLEQRQTLMTAANRVIRKHDGGEACIPELMAIGLTEEQARKLLEKDFVGRIGFADYQTKNNGAEIRRLKQRLGIIERAATAPAREPVVVGDVRIEEGVNRVRIIFSGKPAEQVRKTLRSEGFVWSPTVGAWQRMASEYAWQRALYIAGQVG